VRSKEEHLPVDDKFKLGFCKNFKRLNVAISRAQALLIIIGNGTLFGNHDSHWQWVLQYPNLFSLLSLSLSYFGFDFLVDIAGNTTYFMVFLPLGRVTEPTTTPTITTMVMMMVMMTLMSIKRGGRIIEISSSTVTYSLLHTLLLLLFWFSVLSFIFI
jgi:hypothetical protein